MGLYLDDMKLTCISADYLFFAAAFSPDFFFDRNIFLAFHIDSCELLKHSNI